MKLTLSLIVFISVLTGTAYAQDGRKDSLVSVEHPPQFPGGDAAFGQYISKNLKYPKVARLIGINGRVQLSFVINRDGKIVEATPINCIGAGCEAEAVKVLEMSPTWSPGIQQGRTVRVRYTIPINFSIPKGKVRMRDLDASDYGFIFSIQGKLYNLSEAQTIIGKAFESDQIEIAEPFYNRDNDPKYAMPDKKEVYVLKLKA